MLTHNGDEYEEVTSIETGFQMGDLCRCPYYKFVGRIIEIRKFKNGQVHVTLQNDKGHTCYTSLEARYNYFPFNFYLQLLCKKNDVETLIQGMFREQYKDKR